MLMASAMTIKMMSELKDKGDILRGTAATRDAIVVDVTVPCGMDSVSSKLEVGKFFKILVYEMYINPKDVQVVKLGSKSRVFVTSPFELPDKFDEMFYDAPEVSISEALGSPRNRRLSFRGSVKNVSPINSGPKWQRRDVDIQDQESRKKIRVKLWGEHANMEPVVDDVVVVKNVTTDIYKNYVSVEATAETSFSVVEIPEKKLEDVIVTGYMPSENYVELVTATNNVLYVDKDILRACIDGDVMEFEDMLPYTCTVGYSHKRKNTVESMSCLVVEEEKEKKE